ncbi:MAG: LolA family protein [Phycisphaerales bacterium]
MPRSEIAFIGGSARLYVVGAVAASVGLLTTVGRAQTATTPAGSTAAQPSEIRSEPVQGGNIKILPDKPIAGFSNADQLLAELETADQDLRALQAKIRYTRDFAIAGDTQVRTGVLWFQDVGGRAATGADRKRRFAIRFDKLAFGNREEDKTQIYNFDGEWLVERFPDEKRMVKRQVVRPGETFDPLKIGEGPLPIPIGQRKDDILARYDATLLPPDDGFDEMPAERMKELTEMAQDCVQLMLVPRAERAETDDFKEIRLWYRRQTLPNGKEGRLLPRIAKTVNRADDISVVQLLDVKTNDKVELDPSVFDTKTPPDGWDVIVQPFRGSIEADGEPATPATPAVAPAGAGRAVDAVQRPQRPENTVAPSSATPAPKTQPK